MSTDLGEKYKSDPSMPSGDSHDSKTKSDLPTVPLFAEAMAEIEKNSLVDRLEALETLLIYAKNLVDYPDDKKYRRVNKSNIHFEERLGRLRGCSLAMSALGFQLEGDFFCINDDKSTKNGTILDIQKIINHLLTEIRKEFQALPVRIGGDHVFSSVQGVGAHSAIGKRLSMEDDEIIVDGFGGNKLQGYFGLYDGHGGRDTVDFVVKTLHMNLEQYLTLNPNSGIEQAFTHGYLTTDGQLRRQNILKSGTTAVTCVIRMEGDKRMLHTANVGDSRAVLCRDKKAVALTIDHKPTLPEETKRIRAAGGDVRGKRVNGVLAVSRALGDHLMLKENDVVSASPYVTTTELTDLDDYLILACDGVWDVMSNQDACDYVYNQIRTLTWNGDLGQEGKMMARGWKPASGAESLQVNKILQDTAKGLVGQALELRSQDNVTVMVIKL